MSINLIYKSCQKDFTKLEEYKKFLEIYTGINIYRHPYFLKLLFQLYLFWVYNKTFQYPLINNNPLNLIPVALEIINNEDCDFLFYLDNNDIKINKKTLNMSIDILSLIEKSEINKKNSIYIQIYGDIKQDLDYTNFDKYLEKFLNLDFHILSKNPKNIILVSLLMPF